MYLQVHQFERELDRLRARQKTEMEQKLKQMMADERRLLKHIKDKQDSDMKAFASDQKAAYKAAKNQFKRVCILNITPIYSTCTYNPDQFVWFSGSTWAAPHNNSQFPLSLFPVSINDEV